MWSSRLTWGVRREAGGGGGVSAETGALLEGGGTEDCTQETVIRRELTLEADGRRRLPTPVAPALSSASLTLEAERWSTWQNGEQRGRRCPAPVQSLSSSGPSLLGLPFSRPHPPMALGLGQRCRAVGSVITGMEPESIRVLVSLIKTFSFTCHL